jgi:hypothetical protein
LEVAMPLPTRTSVRNGLPAAGAPGIRGVAGAALGATARRAAGPLVRWSVEAQLTARRNAMVASTALAQRRAEREEVEELVAALAARGVGARGRRTSPPAAAHG